MEETNGGQLVYMRTWSSKGRCPVSRRDYEREMTVESMRRLSTEASWDRVEDVEATRGEGCRVEAKTVLGHSVHDILNAGR